MERASHLRLCWKVGARSYLLALVLIAGLASCNSDTETPTGPSQATTTVGAILANPIGFGGEVVLEGTNVRATGDPDELFFSDGTGEIVADYPSGNVPPLNTPVRIFGRVASTEIDVSRWESR